MLGAVKASLPRMDQSLVRYFIVQLLHSVGESVPVSPSLSQLAFSRWNPARFGVPAFTLLIAL